jgi:predicted amino acid racemase
VLPDDGTLERIALDMRHLRRDSGQKLPRCSIGGSLFLSWLEGVRMPEEITELRLGESWFCASCATTGERYWGYHDDVFLLELEAFESWTKKVNGSGQGRNAQGGQTLEPFKGPRRRVVLEGGENVAPWTDLTPLQPGAVLIGATHEHTVVDVTAMDNPPTCGDTLLFRPGYEAVTRAVLSPYVEICICEN